MWGPGGVASSSSTNKNDIIDGPVIDLESARDLQEVNSHLCISPTCPFVAGAFVGSTAHDESEAHAHLSISPTVPFLAPDFVNGSNISPTAPSLRKRRPSVTSNPVSCSSPEQQCSNVDLSQQEATDVDIVTDRCDELILSLIHI